MKIPNPIRRIKRITTAHTLYRQHKHLLSPNRQLKDIHKGKRCFIIATGPSIKNQDLTKLRNELTFVVNAFWNHSQYQEINPSYYILFDAEIFPNKKERGGFLQKEFINKAKVIESCSNTELFLHANAQPLVKEHNLFPKQNVHYLAAHGYFSDNLKFNINIDHLFPTPKNVVIASLITASYMGFEKIYLLGCDHDFAAHPSKNAINDFHHFYKTHYNLKDKKVLKDYAIDQHSYEGQLHHVLTLFKNYRLLKNKLAKERPNTQIFNATPNSFLDVFPVKDFKSIQFIQ